MPSDSQSRSGIETRLVVVVKSLVGTAILACIGWTIAIVIAQQFHPAVGTSAGFAWGTFIGARMLLKSPKYNIEVNY